jgi:hypothetical protein
MRLTMFRLMLLFAFALVITSQMGKAQNISNGRATEPLRLQQMVLSESSDDTDSFQDFYRVQQDDDLSCKISATSQPWNPPGVMDVSIDGTNVGSFNFGPNGSTALNFSCTAGRHTFTFSIENTNVSCSASFSVSKDKTSFTPMMWIAPNGTVSCGLQ